MSNSILESKLFGLRYIASYLSNHKSLDHDLTEQLRFLGHVSRYSDISKSQLGQDIFALLMNDFCQEGFFIDVGAFDGVDHSNTYLLEKKYLWNGILIEANPNLHPNIEKTRTAKLVKSACYSESGLELNFKITANSSISTLEICDGQDLYDRSASKLLKVQTQTLQDIIDESNAPNIIDFVSIDVEGAELSVLNGINFNKSQINCFCIEINADEDRLSKIDVLLRAYDYIRVLRIVSDFDAFYVKRDLWTKWSNNLRIR